MRVQKLGTFSNQHDIIKDAEGLWGGLQQRNHDGVVGKMGQVPEELDDLEGS